MVDSRALTIRLFTRPLVSVEAVLNECLRHLAVLSGSNEFGIDAEITSQGLFRRRKLIWQRLDDRVWAEILAAASRESLGYVRVSYPNLPVDRYDASSWVKLLFDSDKNVLVILETNDASRLAGEAEISQVARDAFGCLCNAAGSSVAYGYADVGEYRSEAVKTLTVDGMTVPIFSSRAHAPKDDKFLDLGVDVDRNLMWKIVSGRGVRGIYWLNCFGEPFAGAASSAAREAWEPYAHGGLVQLGETPFGALDDGLRNRIRSAVTTIR
jgi:hypothetical protein